MNPNDQVPAEPTEDEIAQFIRECDEGKHPLSQEDLDALKKAEPELFRKIAAICIAPAPPVSAESVTEMAEHVSVIPEHVSAPTPQEDATPLTDALEQKLIRENCDGKNPINYGVILEELMAHARALESRAVKAERELAEAERRLQSQGERQIAALHEEKNRGVAMQNEYLESMRLLRAERDSLAARLAWRDIATAPKDRAILAVVDGETRVVHWGKTSHVSWHGFCLVDQGPENFDICHPTLWMERPQPPDARRAEG